MSQSLYRRRPTRTVFAGQIGIGGANPIRIQSMTTSDTCDTVAVTREIRQLVNAGCEIIRLTVPTQADCDNLANIRREMASMGLKAPLVADIHFTPTVAMKVVDYVEKIRINPGNFADKKLFKTFEIKDEDYAAELSRIEEKFAPLVLKCKDRGVAMRIGTNHGSLSDRIMNRYGDTPLGMVESALEFLRIAAKLHYHDIVLSMKASNPQVMVTAYRELVRRMNLEGFDYPLHLGVTEAGEGEDARIKSAMGIGTLLEEGIGDTVRVSLTEDSVYEIPVAGALVAPYNQKFYFSLFNGDNDKPLPEHLAFLKNGEVALSYSRRPTLKQAAQHLSWGESETVRVWSRSSREGIASLKNAANSEMQFEGVEFNSENYSPAENELAGKSGLLTSCISDSPSILAETQSDKRAFIIRSRSGFSALEKLMDVCATEKSHLEIVFDAKRTESAGSLLHDAGFASALKNVADLIHRKKFKALGFSLISDEVAVDYRILAYHLDQADLPYPIHLRYTANARPLQLDAATQLGALLIDGIGDSLQVDGEIPAADNLSLCYGILQAARVRISKTEFIACPSCGRTQFHLQEVTARIKARTSHLKGLKIAIMGCIVNGPGEMADADFGYVGTGVGKISLYVGKECVERNLPEANALDSLVELIKKHGKWVDAA